ncbi:MAG: hypothetical protein ACE5JI_18075, partial [Acidobacteriota bacterium]
IPLFTEMLSLEGEDARSREEEGSPSLTLVSGSLLLISPVEIVRLRPYFVSGLGIYRQISGGLKETSVAATEGLGLFFRLGGPLEGRLDYRVVQLRGEPLEEKQKRFYAGLSLHF